jgi:hypothetical protein
MSRRSRIIGWGAAAAVLAATFTTAVRAGAVPTDAGRAAQPVTSSRCSTAWGTGAKTTGFRMSQAELYQVRAGRHTCFDRLVLDVDGTAPVGATVRYVRTVLSDPAGRAVRVSGHAALQITVRAPWLGAGSSGHQPYRRIPAVGTRLVPAGTLGGLAVVRDVRFAGTFEGVSTVAVGVASRLPVRVFVLAGDGRRRVVVDVARG